MSNKRFVKKSLREVIDLVQDNDIPETGTLVVYIDLDPESFEVRYESGISTRDDTGRPGDPFP